MSYKLGKSGPCTETRPPLYSRVSTEHPSNNEHVTCAVLSKANFAYNARSRKAQDRLFRSTPLIDMVHQTRRMQPRCSTVRWYMSIPDRQSPRIMTAQFTGVIVDNLKQESLVQSHIISHLLCRECTQQLCFHTDLTQLVMPIPSSRGPRKHKRTARTGASARGSHRCRDIFVV